MKDQCQGKALSHLLQYGRLTIQEYEKLYPEINRRSLQRDLKESLEKKVKNEISTGPTDPTCQ